MPTPTCTRSRSDDSSLASPAKPQGQHVCACAAALVAENPTATFVTRMQQWDYRLGITASSGCRCLTRSLFVAPGGVLRVLDGRHPASGGLGWPDAIGRAADWARRDGHAGLARTRGGPAGPRAAGRGCGARAQWTSGGSARAGERAHQRRVFRPHSYAEAASRAREVRRRDRLPRASAWTSASSSSGCRESSSSSFGLSA